MGDDRTLARHAARVGASLRARGWRLALAESCTGGWIAKVVTDIPGSSDWFDVGFVTYANRAKQTQLGVSAATLERHGAVSAETVAEMAAGALARSGCEVALAVSGVAGPAGGSADKPVGTVWFCWRTACGDRASRCLRFDGDRDAVRRQAVAEGLAGLLRLLGAGDD